MRVLSAPPKDVLTSRGAPNVGSYEGPLPRVDLSGAAGALALRVRRKRWTYVAVASERLYVGAAIVDVGYASNAFVFVFDRERGLLVDRAALGPSFAIRVEASAEEGAHARFAMGRTRLSWTRPSGSTAYDLEIRAADVDLRARLETAGAPPPIAAIADLGEGRMNATEKRALLPTIGVVTVRGEAHRLDGALGGFDYTHGLLRRNTVWRWAFLLGRAATGERVALNLVEGFVGESECCVWVDDKLYPVGLGRFSFDPTRPLGPWKLATTCGAVDLGFEAGGAHEERTNLGVVRSRFVQPVGVYRGTITLPGRAPLVIQAALGVTEDQDVLW